MSAKNYLTGKQELLVKAIVLLGFYLMGVVAKAQQTPLYNQYFLNPYLYNPATVGLGGETKAYFLYRRQWIDIEGSPETQAFTIDGKLRNKRVGLGFSFFNDVTNIIGRTSGALTAAYTLQLAKDQSLSFGMSAMMIQNRIQFEKIQAPDMDDPNLLNQSNNKTAFEGNVGLSYEWRGLRVGFAADQIFQNEINYENAAQFESVDFNYVRHYVSSVEYKIPLKHDFSLKPMVLVRTVEGLPSQVDANVLFDYRDQVWASVAYRHDIGVGLSAGLMIDDQFVLGYAYEIPTSDLSILGTGSHEFVLGIRIRNKGGNRSMTNKHSKELVDELRKDRAKELEEMDAIRQQHQRTEEKLGQYKRIIDRQQEELEQLRSEFDQLQEDLEKFKDGFEYIEGEAVDSAAGYYVIVGAFRTMEGAKLHQKILKRDGDISTKVTQNNKKTWYLIYTEQIEDLATMDEKFRELNESRAAPYIMGNPWVFIKKEER